MPGLDKALGSISSSWINKINSMTSLQIFFIPDSENTAQSRIFDNCSDSCMVFFFEISVIYILCLSCLISNFCHFFLLNSFDIFLQILCLKFFSFPFPISLKILSFTSFLFLLVCYSFLTWFLFFILSYVFWHLTPEFFWLTLFFHILCHCLMSFSLF